MYLRMCEKDEYVSIKNIKIYINILSPQLIHNRPAGNFRTIINLIFIASSMNKTI